MIDLYHPPVNIVIDFRIVNQIGISILGACDFAELNDFFGALNQSCILDADFISIDDIIKSFYDALFLDFQIHTPISSIRDSFHPPWITPELRSLKNRCNSMYRTFRQLKTPQSYHIYTEARSLLHFLTKQSYKCYILNLHEDLRYNPNRFWSYVHLKRKSQGCPCQMFLNDKCSSTTKSSINLFAKFFSSVYLESSSNLHTAPFTQLSHVALSSYSIPDCFQYQTWS